MSGVCMCKLKCCGLNHLLTRLQHQHHHHFDSTTAQVASVMLNQHLRKLEILHLSKRISRGFFAHCNQVIGIMTYNYKSLQ